MPDTPEPPAREDPLVAPSPGLVALLAEAQDTWVARARDAAADERRPADPAQVLARETPGWRPFEDAFPTFYQFTNRPR